MRSGISYIAEKLINIGATFVHQIEVDAICADYCVKHNLTWTKFKKQNEKKCKADLEASP